MRGGEAERKGEDETEGQKRRREEDARREKGHSPSPKREGDEEGVSPKCRGLF